MYVVIFLETSSLNHGLFVVYCLVSKCIDTFQLFLCNWFPVWYHCVILVDCVFLSSWVFSGSWYHEWFSAGTTLGILEYSIGFYFSLLLLVSDTGGSSAFPLNLYWCHPVGDHWMCLVTALHVASTRTPRGRVAPLSMAVKLLTPLGSLGCRTSRVWLPHYHRLGWWIWASCMVFMDNAECGPVQKK